METNSAPGYQVVSMFFIGVPYIYFLNCIATFQRFTKKTEDAIVDMHCT